MEKLSQGGSFFFFAEKTAVLSAALLRGYVYEKRKTLLENSWIVGGLSNNHNRIYECAYFYMERSAGHNRLYARKHEKYAVVCNDFTVITTHYCLVRAEKVKAVGTSFDRKRKKYGNQNMDFGSS